MCSILEDCIEEYDMIGQDLLDILLVPLLPPSQAKNFTAYDCVINVLRNTSACIQVSISAFINHVLMGTSLPGRAKTSRLTDHIYLLLSELHIIHPGFLTLVSPSICVQSGAEGEDICSNPLKLLRDLLSSNHTDCTTEFSIDLQNLLDRFKDLSGVIQLAKGDKVTSMPSIPHNCYGDEGDKLTGVSTKINDAMAVSDIPIISQSNKLSLAINGNKSIDPQRNSFIDDIIASKIKDNGCCEINKEALKLAAIAEEDADKKESLRLDVIVKEEVDKQETLRLAAVAKEEADKEDVIRLAASSSLTRTESNKTCDKTQLRKAVFDLLDSYESLETISTKELRKHCGKELKLSKDALKAPQNKELFLSIVYEYETLYNQSKKESGIQIDQNKITSSSSSNNNNNSSSNSSSSGSRIASSITSRISSDVRSANVISKNDQNEEAEYRRIQVSDAVTTLILKVCDKDESDKKEALRFAVVAREEADKKETLRLAAVDKEEADKQETLHFAAVAKEGADKEEVLRLAAVAKEETNRKEIIRFAVVDKEVADKKEALRLATVAKEEADRKKVIRPTAITKKEADKKEALRLSAITKERVDKREANRLAAVDKKEADKKESLRLAAIAKEEADRKKVIRSAAIDKKKADKKEALHLAAITEEEADWAIRLAAITKKEADKKESLCLAAITKERVDRKEANRLVDWATCLARMNKEEPETALRRIISWTSSSASSLAINLMNKEKVTRLAAITEERTDSREANRLAAVDKEEADKQETLRIEAAAKEKADKQEALRLAALSKNKSGIDNTSKKTPIACKTSVCGVKG
jgi:hypothetical protein